MTCINREENFTSTNRLTIERFFSHRSDFKQPCANPIDFFDTFKFFGAS